MVFARGMHAVADGCHAYLQPDGSWGWSNAGLVVGDGRSLLVDTLFDLRLTRTMLDTMATITDAAPIATVVNTHANGDHCYGNELLADREIISSVACAEEMPETPPTVLAAMNAAEGPVGELFRSFFGAFDFTAITPTLPSRTFEGSLTVDVAGRTVELIEVGPAHTRGDVVAWVPDERVLYTGDILFSHGTPIVWAGPISNWITALDRLIGLRPAHVVPGHGPLATTAELVDERTYLEMVQREATVCFAAGLDPFEAAQEIVIGEFGDWTDSERLAVNVDSVYRELDPARATPRGELFGRMAALRGRLRR
jgi:cyclase